MNACVHFHIIERAVLYLFLKPWCLNIFCNSEVLTSDIFYFFVYSAGNGLYFYIIFTGGTLAKQWDLLLCSLRLRSHAENKGMASLNNKRANSWNRVGRHNVDKAFKILPFSSAELILSCYNLASTVPSIFSYWS